MCPAKNSGDRPHESRRPSAGYGRGLSPVFFAVAITLACALPLVANATPSFQEVKSAWRSSDTILLDRQRAPLQHIRTDKTVRRLQWVALNEISPALKAALIASEDQRFHEHSGVDWKAVGSAAWSNSTAKNQSQRGASTITMQLAGLLDPELHPALGRRNLGQKWQQMGAARDLEKRWKKHEILEAYLNLVTYRGELEGVDALSRGLFGKAAHGLNGREAAIAAALVRSPNSPAAKVTERACGVLRSQGESCDGLPTQVQLILRGAYGTSRASSAAQDAPHFGRLAIAGAVASAASAASPVSTTSHATISSTLDGDLQRFARIALQRQLQDLAGRNVEDGAVVVLDNATGETLAWIGSSGSYSRAAQVDGASAWRQAGSTLKPFLYAQAISEGRLTAASLLDDSPAELATATGLYVPRNYNNGYRGLVSVRTALASSLNVPAVRTIVMTGTESFAHTLRGFGLTSLKEAGDYYGYSLALGSADVSLGELTEAYRRLGRRAQIGSSGIVPEEPRGAVISKEAAFIIADVLADNSARLPTFGPNNVLETPFWSAVKTGTSKDMRDNWCIGFSKRYTVGVWVGNASGLPMHDVSGVSGAAPVWKEVMLHLHRAVPKADRLPPEPPPTLLRERVTFAPEVEASRDELFVPGSARRQIAAAPRAARAAGIAYPTDGMIVAIDPDMPPARQRLRWQLHGPASTTLELNGKPVARESLWFPVPGKHVLALKDSGGQEIERVRFEVRGAQILKMTACATHAALGCGALR